MIANYNHYFAQGKVKLETVAVGMLAKVVGKNHCTGLLQEFAKVVGKNNHTGLLSEDLKVVGNNHYTKFLLADSKVVGNNHYTGLLQEEPCRHCFFVRERLHIHRPDTVWIGYQLAPSLLCCTRCISLF